MMTEPLMFLAFGALLSLFAVAVGIAVWLGIESRLENKASQKENKQ